MIVEVLIEQSPVEVLSQGEYKVIEILLNATINSNGGGGGQIYARDVRYTLEKTVEQALDELNNSSATGGDVIIVRTTGVSAPQSIAVPAGSRVESVDFVRITGTPLISLGSSSNTWDFLEDYTLTEDVFVNMLHKPFKSAGNIFANIQNGTVTIIMRYISKLYQ